MYSEVCYTSHTFGPIHYNMLYNWIWLEKHHVSSHKFKKTKNEHVSPSNTKYNTVQVCTGAQGHCLANPDISQLITIHRCSKQVMAHTIFKQIYNCPYFWRATQPVSKVVKVCTMKAYTRTWGTAPLAPHINSVWSQVVFFTPQVLYPTGKNASTIKWENRWEPELVWKLQKSEKTLVSANNRTPNLKLVTALGYPDSPVTGNSHI